MSSLTYLDAEQDPYAGNIYIVVPKFAGVRGDDFGHLLTLDQHANGCIWLARYGFLLMFYSDLRSRWNCYGELNAVTQDKVFPILTEVLSNTSSTL